MNAGYHSQVKLIHDISYLFVDVDNIINTRTVAAAPCGRS